MILPDFIKNLKSKVDHELKKNLYRNLVFKGGGVRGIAYLGALEVLDEIGIFQNIQRVAGTSAGAIAATLVSFPLTIQEARQVFNSLDISQIPHSATDKGMQKLLHPIENANYQRFFKNYGWYSSKYFHKWLEGVIAEQCGGNPRATFADFQALGFRELHIVAANLSRHRAEVFSAARTPNVAVADAVRMSISIPIFFEALRFDGKELGDGDYYVDGGLYDNFPMHIFDQPEFARRGWTYHDSVNWETLGLFLYPAQLRDQDTPDIPENVWEFLTLAFRSMYYSHQISNYQTNPVDKLRTIEISDCGVGSMEFNIKPDDPKYRQLHQSGQNAVREFFGLA